MKSFLPRNQKLNHGPNWKYQFIAKGGGKKFQIVPKGDEMNFEMTTKSGKAVYLKVATLINLATDWIEIHTQHGQILYWTK